MSDRPDYKDIMRKYEAHRRFNRDLFMIFLVTVGGIGIAMIVLDYEILLLPLVMIAVFIPLALIERIYSKKIYSAK